MAYSAGLHLAAVRVSQCDKHRLVVVAEFSTEYTYIVTYSREGILGLFAFPFFPLSGTGTVIWAVMDVMPMIASPRIRKSCFIFVSV